MVLYCLQGMLQIKGESDSKVGDTKVKCLEETQYKNQRAYSGS